MAFFDLPILGRTEFAPTPEGYWDFAFPYASGVIKVDFNINDGEEITEAQFRRVESFVADIGKFDALARAAIREEYEGEGASDSREYHTVHREQLTPQERLQCFGDADGGPDGAEGLLRALKLKRTGLYPSTDQNVISGYKDVVAVFDYTIGADVTQYLIAVYFNDKGEAVCVSMES